MGRTKARVAAVIAAACLIPTGLAACTASPTGQPSSGGSSAKADIVSLVDASAKTAIDQLESTNGAPTGNSNIKLCYVTRTVSNEFWGYERAGFEAAAKKYGVQSQTFAVTDEASITEQLDKANSALKGGCSAILASPISATALDSVFKVALAQGIPAIILNDAQGTVPGVVYVGPDALVIGKTAADYIAKQLPNGGKVAMVEGDPGSSNALNRGKGFKAGLAAYPNLQLVASATAKWDTNLAQTVAAGMLTANPDIKAFYVQNDGMALGVQAAIAAKGLTGKVILVGTDGIPQAKLQIAAGDKGYTATVSERPTTEGGAGVEAALWLLAGKKVAAWVDVPGILIDSSNVGQYPTGMP